MHETMQHMQHGVAFRDDLGRCLVRHGLASVSSSVVRLPRPRIEAGQASLTDSASEGKEPCQDRARKFYISIRMTITEVRKLR